MGWLIAAIGVAFVFCFYLFLIWPGRLTGRQRAELCGRSYAHRGLFNRDKRVPENSLAAFEAALQAGYGCELDVQFTKDRRLIVFHDSSYLRSCGVDKPVWELNYDEMKDFRLFGTDERIPLFSEVLERVAGRQPLIVEIKTHGANLAWYEAQCREALRLLRGYNGIYCVESFHPLAVRWFRKNARDVARGLLVTGQKSDPHAFSKMLASRLFISCVLCRPGFVAVDEEARNMALFLVRKMGAATVAWTVKTPRRFEELSGTESAIIFEGFTPPPYFKTRH